ncbi:MAG TPA: glycosyltransferase 87 family protein [Ornithinibacter sp.]|nr:glycosyltransferase 87 family protein [Ornithinibacter sp.]
MAERADATAPATPRAVDRPSGRPSPAWVLAVLLGAAMVWMTWHSIRKGIWVDLDVYVAGGRAVLDRSDLYAVSVHDLPFTYPPFAAVLFAPLALLPDVVARVVLTLVSLAALATVVEVLRRRLALTPLQVVPTVLVVLALEPLLRTLLLGQVNAVLIALVVLDCFVVPERHRGWLIGVAAGIKLTPAIFVVWLLLRREWGAALRAAAAGLVTVGVGLVVAPSSSWFYWSGGFGDLGRFGAAAVLGTDNQSLSAVVARLAGLTSVPAALVLACGLVAVGLGSWVAARCLRRGDDVGALLAVALGGLLASPVSWSHHWLWVAPLLLWAVAARRIAWAVVLAVVCWLGPFWAVYREVPDAAPYPAADRAVAAAYVVVGLVTLAVLARGPSGGPPREPQPSAATSSV